MSTKTLVVDLFAGPGGLGEGFSSYVCEGERPFKLAASVEMEPTAHRTLTLRAFFRQFDYVPDGYYEYVRAATPSLRDELFSQYQPQSEAAVEETLGGPKELGDDEDDKQIFSRIHAAIDSHQGPKIVIGGPPCQAYSLVGRSRNKGIKDYSFERDGRASLYLEYLKVLDVVKPEVFVMENVRGILSAKFEGEPIFEKILKDLKNPSKSVGENKGSEYEIFSLVTPLPPADVLGERSYLKTSDYLIKAENYGIPQARHRVILLGVKRGILRSEPEILVPTTDLKLTTGDLIEDLPRLRSGLTKIANTDKGWVATLKDASKEVRRVLRKRGFEVSEDYPFDGPETPPSSQGGSFVPFEESMEVGGFKVQRLRDWFLDDRVGGFLNHSARGHMPSDLYRYLYSSCFAQLNDGASPTANNYPPELKPNHKNWKSGKFVDRFKVQASVRIPSTVTKHISKDGHYFIHYDPTQCRSLTVREAARIQTFPDNYFFEGCRTDQYGQVGNAVPPLLANKIARIVHGILTQ
jgi:DNA (cytosine-5)-methyltransferase 1